MLLGENRCFRPALGISHMGKSWLTPLGRELAMKQAAGFKEEGAGGGSSGVEESEELPERASEVCYARHFEA